MVKCMISAPQPEAVEVGLEVFKKNENVMDAAIAAAMVQTVVDPQMCGIAGFGSMQIMMPGKGVNTFIDFHGKAPLAVKSDMWAHLIERECDDGFGFVGDERFDLGWVDVEGLGVHVREDGDAADVRDHVETEFLFVAAPGG